MDIDIFIKFFWIVIAVFGGIVIFATAVKLREVRRCSTWLTTSGKIITSKVESRRRGGVKKGYDDDTLGNYPLVVYEYKVGNHRYKGKRISVGEQMPDFQVRETLEKYPIGAAVDVYYNPKLPGQSVLERDLPPNFTKAFTGLILSLLAAAIILPVGLNEFTSRVAAYIDNPNNAVIVTVLLGMVIFIVLLTFVFQRQFQEAADWPTTSGKVDSSFVEACLSSTPISDNSSVFKRTVVYQPKVIYSYEVRGQIYKGDRLAIGGIFAGSVAAWLFGRFKIIGDTDKHTDFVDTTPDKRGNPNSVPAWVKRKVLSYPKDMALRVFYNPENPAQAVIEKKIQGFLWLYAVAVALLLLALKVAGIIGH